MFRVEYHMERFSDKLGHSFVTPCCGGQATPRIIGEMETYDKALGLVYRDLECIYPYPDMVKVVMRRGELVAFLKEDPLVEQHYTIKKC